MILEFTRRARVPQLLVVQPVLFPSLLPVCFEDEEMERAWALDLVLLPWTLVLVKSSVGFDEN